MSGDVSQALPPPRLPALVNEAPVNEAPVNEAPVNEIWGYGSWLCPVTRSLGMQTRFAKPKLLPGSLSCGLEGRNFARGYKAAGISVLWYKMTGYFGPAIKSGGQLWTGGTRRQGASPW